VVNPTFLKLPAIDVALVGAGAAGLASAIFSARRMPGRRIVALDGAKKPGAKILVAGGGRCNVTNVRVQATDYWGGSRNTIRQVLASFTAEAAVDFFREIGVEMHVEEHGKLFPNSNSAKTVLAALLAEAERRGVSLAADHRVLEICKNDDRFLVTTSQGEIRARAVVLATGGKSLPKTGSDGGGYALAEKLGHSLVATTPGLAPLILEGDFHAALSGVSLEVELAVCVENMKPLKHRGAMLWTHFGVSGPAALDVSRLWHRAALDGKRVEISANFFPGANSAEVESKLMALSQLQPRTILENALATLIPARLAEAVLRHLGVEARIIMAHLSKETRRKLVEALTHWPLPVRDSRGYNFAEVTAGGVPLSEIDPRTMESRVCPGLFLVGEILDVDGRIGGFNFQWAWSSGFVAGNGLAKKFGERTT
jgi:predicted Rossmann fold flavoprotein